MLTYLYTIPMTILISIIIIFSLLIGSFINVVVYRLPLMLHRQWWQDSTQFLKQNSPGSSNINLIMPSSHCTLCKNSLGIRHMIPIVSYLIYKCRCQHCQQAIPKRYLLIEITVLLSSIFILWNFYLTPQLIPALLLTWVLITLAWLDLYEKLLPDIITLPTIWFGLLINTQCIFCTPTAAIWGTTIAYLSMSIVTKLVSYLTTKPQMSHGDFKCFAIGGAWLGYENLPIMLFIAALSGCLHFAVRYWQGKTCQEAIPFGPYIAFAIWLHCLLY